MNNMNSRSIPVLTIGDRLNSLDGFVLRTQPILGFKTLDPPSLKKLDWLKRCSQERAAGIKPISAMQRIQQFDP